MNAKIDYCKFLNCNSSIEVTNVLTGSTISLNKCEFINTAVAVKSSTEAVTKINKCTFLGIYENDKVINITINV